MTTTTRKLLGGAVLGPKEIGFRPASSSPTTSRC